MKKCSEALVRYKKQLLDLGKRILEMEYEGEYICFNNAAEALISFYDEELETSLIIDKIEKAIMFQRCFSKVKELYDNNLKIEEFDCVKGIKAKYSLIPSWIILQKCL